MLSRDETKWLDLVRLKPYAFGLESGFEDLKDIHNEWIRSFLFEEDDQTLQAHRGSYKTTCLSIAMALMIVIYPMLNILFFRKTDDDVKEVVTQTAKLLKSWIFQQLSMALYGVPVILLKETAFEIDTNLKSTSRGASQLLGIGSRASITGKHGDIIITDDVINLSDRISKADRDRTKLMYQELQNIKNLGGRFINTGTPWHPEDAFTLMPNIKRYDCYSTGLMSTEQVQEKKDAMTPSLFAANYELKHVSDADALFTNAVIDDGTNTAMIYNGICHIDAAYGGPDGSAFTILKKQPDGKIYVYGALKEQTHIDDCLHIFEAKRIEYRGGTVYNEKNADKGYLAKKIIQPVNTYHESMNKYVKISTYLRESWKNIVFIKDTDPEYINQILDYTEDAEHDDAPDSLASLLRAQGSRVTVQLFKHGI